MISSIEIILLINTLNIGDMNIYFIRIFFSMTSNDHVSPNVKDVKGFLHIRLSLCTRVQYKCYHQYAQLFWISYFSLYNCFFIPEKSISATGYFLWFSSHWIVINPSSSFTSRYNLQYSLLAKIKRYIFFRTSRSVWTAQYRLWKESILCDITNVAS